MKKILLVIPVAALAITGCSKKGGTAPDPNPPIPVQNDIASLDSKVATFMTTYSIPGASLAVSKNGKLVYRKGYGKADQGTGEAVTVDSRFRLASVSKTFTGVAVLKLVQEGKLNLDAKVFGSGAVLGTEFGTSPYSSNLGNITVRQLLQHISGGWGFNSGGDPIDQNPSYSNTQFFNWVLNNKPVQKAPGTAYDYSNMNYFILGRIIEKISGKSYTDYIKQDIMAGIGGTQTDIAGKTAGERKTNEVKYYGQGNDAPYVYNIAFPRRDADGGLITTATDLLRLVNAIDGFTTRADILNTATLNEFVKAPAINPGYACGIGVWAAENVWFNYGSLPGTRTGFMRRSNGMNVSLLLNTRADPSGNESPFIYAMQDLLLDIVKSTVYTWQDIDQF